MNMAKYYTGYYTVHEVIDPRETRPRIIRALRAAANKLEETLEKRRYIKPA
jgi:acetyl-CoA carboxylase carboxyltransferase component